MGIYVAVFVAKCCEGLIKGVSTGRVTAGLMGGRMGNKGGASLSLSPRPRSSLFRDPALTGSSSSSLPLAGVGISLHLHQTRLLFISAHLAAHASGLEFRKANALKILDELVVDDFWDNRGGEQGPRPEKLVDRFDGVFFAGDLKCVPLVVPLLAARPCSQSGKLTPFLLQLPPQHLAPPRRLARTRQGLLERPTLRPASRRARRVRRVLRRLQRGRHRLPAYVQARRAEQEGQEEAQHAPPPRRRRQDGRQGPRASSDRPCRSLLGPRSSTPARRHDRRRDDRDRGRLDLARVVGRHHLDHGHDARLPARLAAGRCRARRPRLARHARPIDRGAQSAGPVPHARQAQLELGGARVRPASARRERGLDRCRRPGAARDSQRALSAATDLEIEPVGRRRADEDDPGVRGGGRGRRGRAGRVRGGRGAGLGRARFRHVEEAASAELDRCVLLCPCSSSSSPSALR